MSLTRPLLRPKGKYLFCPVIFPFLLRDPAVHGDNDDTWMPLGVAWRGGRKMYMRLMIDL